MTARLSLFFSYDKDKQIFHYSLLCIYTICSKSVLSSQHGCTGHSFIQHASSTFVLTDKICNYFLVFFQEVLLLLVTVAVLLVAVYFIFYLYITSDS